MRRAQLLLVRALNSVNKVRIGSNTVDVTRIVAEEDTTKGGKGTHDVGLPGDGSLDVLNVRSGMKSSLLTAVLFNTCLFGGRHDGGVVLCFSNAVLSKVDDLLLEGDTRLEGGGDIMDGLGVEFPEGSGDSVDAVRVEPGKDMATDYIYICG